MSRIQEKITVVVGPACDISTAMIPTSKYESKTNSGTRHQFWDQGACNWNFSTQSLIWKCTHNSCRSQLHADIIFLSIRPLITHAEMPFGEALKSNMEKIITLI